MEARESQEQEAGAAPSANPQTYNLTYNIVATTAYAGDGVATMNVQFSFNNQLLWATMVNQNNPSSTTNVDQNFGGVTIKAGSTVSLALFGPLALVRFSGTLADGQGDTTINGAQMAKFQLTPSS
jgi:hypothetical protein